MPTLYPGAAWRPLGPQTQGRMARHDLIILHTMAGTLPGTDAWFRDHGYGGTESHFGVGPDGEVRQWQDLEYVAEANYEANDRAISIETADRGPGFPKWSGDDVPAWTGDQLAALARLIAWCCRRYSIPCALVPDSRESRRGVGYHRQGIDPTRVAGGERWSTVTGKTCPSTRRIAQVPALVAAAARIDGPVGPPAPPPGRRMLMLTQPAMTGDDVRELQAVLNRTYPAYSHLAVDGAFGPATAAVVREFQRRSGLTPDGVVGPATRAALRLP